MTPSSVLVVKPSSLGDIVHTLPAVHYLKATFPDAQISWIANTEWVPLLEENSGPQNSRPISPKSNSGDRSGSSNSSDGAMNYLAWSPTSFWIFKGYCGAHGFHEAQKGSWCSVCLIQEKDPASVTTGGLLVNASQHSVDRYLALARLAGADTSGPIEFPLPRGKAISSLELPERFVVLHPFARGVRKSLTPEEIFEFTRLLVPIPVIVVGRSSGHFEMDRNGVSLVNQTDLSELIWLLRRSSFIVSVDSGPMHIGAAITPELLSIHTWSDPGSVGPYNPEAWIWKGSAYFSSADPTEREKCSGRKR